MTAALLLGGGIGAGVWMIALGLWPPQPSLAEALEAMYRRPAPRRTSDRREERPTGTMARLGRPLSTAVLGRRPTGLMPISVRRNLALLDRSFDEHVAEKVATGVLGLLLIPAAFALFALGGVVVPVTVAPLPSLVAGAAGFMVPDLAVRSEAGRRRRELRHALSAFVDLTVVSMAAGSGVEAALRHAAASGEGRAFRAFRQALDAARITREPPWTALERLGRDFGVPELEEAAASVGLAGTEGARVRQSLAARAASLRSHRLADAESEAHVATQRMTVTLVLLLIGFLAFVLFPAYSRVFGAL